MTDYHNIEDVCWLFTRTLRKLRLVNIYDSVSLRMMLKDFYERKNADREYERKLTDYRNLEDRDDVLIGRFVYVFRKLDLILFQQYVNVRIMLMNYYDEKRDAKKKEEEARTNSSSIHKTK